MPRPLERVMEVVTPRPMERLVGKMGSSESKRAPISCLKEKHKVRLLSAFHLLFLSCNPKSPFKVVEEFDAGSCETTVDNVTDKQLAGT